MTPYVPHRLHALTELARLDAANQRLQSFTSEAKRLAMDGHDIAVKAIDQGQGGWGSRFGMETMANLTEQYRSVAVEFEGAVEAFMGEKRKAGEASEDFMERIVEAFSDNANHSAACGLGASGPAQQGTDPQDAGPRRCRRNAVRVGGDPAET